MVVEHGKRLLQLWRVYAYLDFMWMTRDLRFFVQCFFSDAVLSIAAITGTFLLAERFSGIGAWSRDQVVFLLGYGMAARGLLDTFFSFNVLHISRRLGRGQLDHTLIQPQSVWLTLLTEGFMPFSGAAVLVPAFGLLFWAAHRMDLMLSAGWLALLGLHLLCSAAVVLAFSFLWGSLAFWAPRAAEEISSSAVGLMSTLKPFPLDGVGPFLLGGLLSFLPVGFVAWYPCRFLLGLDPVAWHGAVTPLFAVVLSFFSLLAFKQGRKHYERVGSQRYLGFGHRS